MKKKYQNYFYKKNSHRKMFFKHKFVILNYCIASFKKNFFNKTNKKNFIKSKYETFNVIYNKFFNIKLKNFETNDKKMNKNI